MMLLLKRRADKQLAKNGQRSTSSGPLVVVVVDLSILHIYSIGGSLGRCGTLTTKSLHLQPSQSKASTPYLAF